ncbi:MAG: DUF167 domain-containing protein [Chloroflexota bacterium]
MGAPHRHARARRAAARRRASLGWAIPELIVRVTPRAAEDRVGPYLRGVLTVRVTKPPTDGEANRAVTRLLASALAVPPSAIALRSGRRGRSKRYLVEGLTAAQLEARLAAIGD